MADFFSMFSSEQGIVLGGVIALAIPLLLAVTGLLVLSRNLARKKRFGAAAVPVVLLLGYFGWIALEKYLAGQENSLVRELVAYHPKLEAMTGQRIRLKPERRPTYQLGQPGTYEFRLDARQPLYAVVKVDRGLLRSSAELACVTTLVWSRRERQQDPCAQDTVPIGDTRYAHPPTPKAPP